MLFPLSLAGLGEMDVVSIFGAVMVVILSGYTVYVAAASGHGISPSEIELKWSTLPESLSELGFAFWLQARSEFGAIRRNYSAQFCAILRRPPPSPPQPCVLPLLRELPEGEVGERVMTKALHLTFSLTTLVYATIGLAGYIAFGDATPPNILGGFKGAVGGVLAFVFCAYICLCFAPTVPPLRETLLRLLCATARRRPPPTPPPPRLSPGTPQNGSVQQASPCPPSLAGTASGGSAAPARGTHRGDHRPLFLVVALLPAQRHPLRVHRRLGRLLREFHLPRARLRVAAAHSLFAPSVDVSPALDAASPPLEPQASPDEPYYRYSPPLSTRLSRPSARTHPPTSIRSRRRAARAAPSAAPPPLACGTSGRASSSCSASPSRCSGCWTL